MTTPTKNQQRNQQRKRRPGRPRTRYPLPGESLEEFTRRCHEALPPIESTAEPAEKYARRRLGGRPSGVRMSLELRIRRAARAGYSNLQLSGADVLELHALYNIINPAGDLVRNTAGLAGSASGFDFVGQSVAMSSSARWMNMTLGQIMVMVQSQALTEESKP